MLNVRLIALRGPFMAFLLSVRLCVFIKLLFRIDLGSICVIKLC